VTRIQIKQVGEASAARFLEGLGMRIVDRNWRCRLGELDLVALDGSTLVFVEVKARSHDSFVDPALGVDHRKRVKVRRVAGAYLALKRPEFKSCRFDVVSVVTGPPLKLGHIIDAF
jgi:putative endonuclease